MTETHDSFNLGNLVSLECPICVDFRERKPEYPEKNPQSTGEINWGTLSHMKRYTRPGFSMVKKYVQRSNRLCR